MRTRRTGPSPALKWGSQVWPAQWERSARKAACLRGGGAAEQRTSMPATYDAPMDVAAKLLIALPAWVACSGSAAALHAGATGAGLAWVKPAAQGE